MRVSDGSICPAVGSVGLIELHLAQGWCRQRVRVVRCSFDEIALHFHEISAALEDAIEDEVVACIEASRRPQILVVDPSPDRRHRIAESLRTAGCESVEAATPLEAIGIVERYSGTIRGMTVSESLTQTSGDEFCDYVSQTNPEIRLRLIAEGTCEIPISPPSGHERDGHSVRVVSDDDTLDLELRDFAADAALTPQVRSS
jgi:CheY-like chemotaxis protein